MALSTEPQTAISLFSGAGGLDLGIKLAVPSCRTVCYVEREAYAAAVLVARMEDALLDSAPIWDDVATFDGIPWRGRVDLVAGGSPCQDLSLAGNGQLLDGARSGLFFEFVRIVREVRPRFIFWENVRGAVRVLPTVLRVFEGLGYRGRFTVVRASDVGAPHERARVFVLAQLAEANVEGRALADADRRGRARERLRGLLDSERAQRGSDADRRLCPRVPLWPPLPSDRDAWGAVVACRPDLEPAIRRMADGLAYRVDRLRLTGNGVVPQQAAHAWRVLYDRLFRFSDAPAQTLFF